MKNVQHELKPNILGQLLLMQSVVINLPDLKSIFAFVCRGLKDIPGVKKVAFDPNDFKVSPEAEVIHFPIGINNSTYGNLIIHISDDQLFTPYSNYLSNFSFMLGVILEERKQRQINEQYQKQLEEKIKERTLQLSLEKENLIESQRRFHDLMSNITLISVMLDQHGRIIFCNNFLLKITGYVSEEVLMQNWFHLFLKKEQQEKALSNFALLLNGTGSSSNYENEILTKSGDTLIIRWNHTVLYDHRNKIIGTASIGDDITEKKLQELVIKEKTEEIKAQNEEYLQINEELFKAKEKAEESDRLKSAFLQNMSHEIRTPLNAIMGFSELLSLHFNDKNKLSTYSSIIQNRCHDLLNIIDDLIDIAKIESGTLYVRNEPYEIKTLFDELNAIFLELKMRQKKEAINLVIDIRDHLEDSAIYTDHGKLKQIFINLFSNALKFSEKGQITCGTQLYNGKILFFVKDMGIGIPANKFDYIFERFSQLNSQPQKNIGGTGLGLSIVKGLVGLLGGKIWLESKVSKGTTFYFTTHLVFADSMQENYPLNHDFLPPTPSQKSILIVEDDYYNSKYLKEIFTEEGYLIKHTEYGNEAIKIATQTPVDIILMDIRLPDMNGYEAVKAILKSVPDACIIAQTAYTNVNERNKALALGCADFVSKPINPELIRNLVHKHLQEI